MKTFDQLTSQQKEKAVNFAAYEIVDHVAQGNLEIELFNAESQKRLNYFLEMGRKLEDQRYVKLHLLHDAPIRKEINRLALVAASGSEYDEEGNPILGEKNETSKTH